MVTFPEFRDYEPAAFTSQAQKWQTLATQVDARGKDMDAHIAALADWEGQTADAAKANLTAKRGALAKSADQLAKIGPVLNGLYQALDPLHEKLREAILTARDNLLEIEPDGTVKPASVVEAPPETVPTPPPTPGQPAPGPPDINALARQLTTEIQGVLRQATTADQQAATALQGLTAAASGLAPVANNTTLQAATIAIPGPGTSPAAVNKWWKSLSVTQQESVLFMHGDLIGGLDGIPADIRDRANRDTLDELKAKLTEQQALIKTKPQPLSDADQNQLSDLQSKLGGIESIEQRLTVTPSAAHPQPYLLKISADGSGRAIVAMGNPDTSANVATFVPGTGSNLAVVGGYLDRTDRMAGAAAIAGSPSTSVITWIGYDAPPDLPHAALDGYAEHAEGDLRNFQDGLRVTHEGIPSHNTVIGHSYGTTTIGYAAKDGNLNANDVAFVASPGVGVYGAKDLHLDGVDPNQMSQHVDATTAEHDIIHLADGAFGPNPSDDGFGATDFASGPGQEGPWYMFGLSGAAHSQYWDPHNPALANLGDIIAGKPPNNH
jgi:hypothetical protein